MADIEMRITHLIKGLGPGGAERLVVTQAGSGHRPDVHHSVVYLLPHKNHLVTELDAADVATTCLDAAATIRPGWVKKLRRLLISEPTDVLHVHSPALAAAARLMIRTIPRRVRPAIVDTEHNRWPRHHRLTRLANRATIRLDDATIAVSEEVRSTIQGRPSDRIHTIVHGIDLAAVRASADRGSTRSELELLSSDVLVVCVANFRREKALDVLIQAAAMAHTEEERLKFVLVGQGPLADEVDRWVKSSGLGGVFRVLGYRDDSTRVMSGADIFTLSSRHEGLPVTIMEALALGVPIVATAAGGIPQAVGDAGIVVPVGDIESLADAWIDLTRDASRRRALGALALAESERFSAERAAREIQQIYDTVTGTAADRPSSHS